LAGSPERKPRVQHNTDPQRVLAICNACRYCEGYCAVFPAMERRTVFTPADVAYLANLCHNCGECYYACPYTPPHEYAVNVPKLLAELRAKSYREGACPRWYGSGTLPVLAVCLIAFFAGIRWGASPAGDFYGVLSHGAMVWIFGAAAILAAIVLGASLARLVRTPEIARSFGAFGCAVRDAMSLRYLSGKDSSRGRRWFHHLTFYGFLFCFASTTSAAIEHYVFAVRAPYPWLSAPVMLGTAGGIGLLIGPAGLFFLKRLRDPAIVDPAQRRADVSFLAMLFLTSVTGLLLLLLRDSPAMSLLLRIHLAVVLALFLTMPYGKFVHGFYRFAALVRYARETATSTSRKAV
jgi:citrate/tricarballylate utilization protein